MFYCYATFQSAYNLFSTNYLANWWKWNRSQSHQWPFIAHTVDLVNMFVKQFSLYSRHRAWQWLSVVYLTTLHNSPLTPEENSCLFSHLCSTKFPACLLCCVLAVWQENQHIELKETTKLNRADGQSRFFSGTLLLLLTRSQKVIHPFIFINLFLYECTE